MRELLGVVGIVCCALMGCAHRLPSDNSYRITITSHVCDPQCHKVTVTEGEPGFPHP